MKIVCECGNEMELIPEIDIEEDERGQYVKADREKFRFWAEHDEAGIVCESCNKAVWYFA